MLSMSFTVRSVEEQFSQALRWHLEPFRTATRQPYGFMVDMFVPEEEPGNGSSAYSFRLGGEDRFSSPSIMEVLIHALWDLHAAVPKKVRDFLFLHAGAAVLKDRAVLLPAVADSGKSTLVTSLGEAGFAYLSDEFAVLDPVTSRAYPFEKRIKLPGDALRFFSGLEERLADREGLSKYLRDRYVRPEDVGTTVSGSAPVGWLVFPVPDWDGPPVLEAMSKAESVEAMAASCFNLYRYGERGVILLARIAKEAQAFRLRGGSPRERAELLTDRLT
jgi:hypothetical protein